MRVGCLLYTFIDSLFPGRHHDGYTSWPSNLAKQDFLGTASSLGKYTACMVSDRAALVISLPCCEHFHADAQTSLPHAPKRWKREEHGWCILTTFSRNFILELLVSKQDVYAFSRMGLTTTSLLQELANRMSNPSFDSEPSSLEILD